MRPRARNRPWRWAARIQCVESGIDLRNVFFDPGQALFSSHWETILLSGGNAPIRHCRKLALNPHGTKNEGR